MLNAAVIGLEKLFVGSLRVLLTLLTHQIGGFIPLPNIQSEWHDYNLKSIEQLETVFRPFKSTL
jgi:hypothetical protein